MQKGREFDYIIVGQGLAGSALSYHLIKSGKSVLVIDEDQPFTSSKVAAGLYNPITGRKMVKTWKADLLFPYLKDFYKELEELCSARFLIETPIYRPFISLEEQNEWMGKSASEEYMSVVKKVHTTPYYDFSNDRFGGIELEQCGYLDVPVYLKAYRNFLSDKDALQNETFDPAQLIIQDNQLIYKNFQVGKIIFCNGLGAVNTFFDWLPFKPVKGEVLQIATDFKLKHILNRGVFIIPIEEGQYRVGSNYDNYDFTTVTTVKARTEIERRLQELVKEPYQVINQVAGIRPATKDRRPFIGMHPVKETIGVFNGLGAKGVSLAPYFSRQYYEFLECGKELDPEVNISRYFSLYFNSLKN